MKKDDPYDILGVPKNASDEDIKKAYREKAKKNHTDKSGGDNDKMVAINRAWSILKNPARRKYYDETGEHEQTPFDQKFAAYVHDVFIKITLAENTPENVDLIEKFKAYSIKIKEQFDQDRKELKTKMKKLEKVLKRLSAKDGKENVINRVLTGTIDGMKVSLTKLDQDISFIKDCIEVLSHYDYKFEQSSEDDLNQRMFGRGGFGSGTFIFEQH